MANAELKNNYIRDLERVYRKKDNKQSLNPCPSPGEIKSVIFGGQNEVERVSFSPDTAINFVTPLMIMRAIMGPENADMWDLVNQYPPSTDDIAEKGDR